MTKELNNKLSQLILRIARSVFSYTVRVDKVGTLQEILEDVVDIIGKIAETKSIEVAKKIQEATKAGFEKFAEDMDALKAKLDAMAGETVKIEPTWPTHDVKDLPFIKNVEINPSDVNKDFYGVD